MKKKPPEHVNLERWLVSYADFITLLFAFFVIMYAISQADIAKFKQAAASLKTAFGAGAPSGMVNLGGQAGGNTLNQFASDDSRFGRVLDMPAGKTHTAADLDELQSLKELMEETISLDLGTSELSDKVRLEYDSRGLVVRLAATDIFDEGEVAVHSDMEPLLDRIGSVLLKTDRLVRVEGHADRREAKGEGYASSWELSAARAAWVVRYWQRRYGIEPKRLGVAGYGHFRPLNSKESNWASGTNRRIEIIILNNRYHDE